jgi:hypothetical protein
MRKGIKKVLFCRKKPSLAAILLLLHFSLIMGFYLFSDDLVKGHNIEELEVPKLGINAVIFHFMKT